MAKMLAREGAKVAVTDVNDKDGERVAGAIGSAGGEAFFRHHDVSDERAWQEAIGATLERFGRLDVLVNNAGVGWGGRPEEQTLERWRALMAINLDGVFLGTKHAIAAMKKNKPSGGSIINLSSIEGIVGDPNLGAYNAAKGGVRLYTMVESYLRSQGDVQAHRPVVGRRAPHSVGRGP
jgi:NAD(P)-dependent dehydrogenase (short-subunit alcohol dehydrogenase family)